MVKDDSAAEISLTKPSNNGDKYNYVSHKAITIKVHKHCYIRQNYIAIQIYSTMYLLAPVQNKFVFPERSGRPSSRRNRQGHTKVNNHSKVCRIPALCGQETFYYLNGSTMYVYNLSLGKYVALHESLINLFFIWFTFLADKKNNVCFSSSNYSMRGTCLVLFSNLENKKLNISY